MTSTAHGDPKRPPLRFKRNLAVIFAMLGVLTATLITLHWFLVLEPTLRWDARSHSHVLAQAGSIEQLLGSSLPDVLRWELETRLDRLLLLKDPSTDLPFMRRITLAMDDEQLNGPPNGLDIARGVAHCPKCFVSEIPLYHPLDEQLIGIATFHASPQFLESMVSDLRIKLLWISAFTLCFIGFAWFGTTRLLRRLGTSESQLKSLLGDMRVALAKYRTLFDAFPFGIAVTDAAGRIMETNAASVHLLGLSQEEHLRRRIDDPKWNTLRPDGSSMPTNEYPALETLARRTVIRDREMGVALPSGEVRWLNVTAAPLPVEDLGAVVVYEDITLRKQAQVAREAEAALRESERRFRIMADEALLESHRELERRAEQLGHLTSELTLAEQRERLANVLHDHLQQLLVAAAFGIERLDRRLRGQMTDKVAKDALDGVNDLLHQAIDAAHTLVADLSPPILHDGGLPDALEWLARSMRKRYDMTVALSLDRDASPRRDDVRSVVFESVRESLFNGVKHAGCTEARLELKRHPHDQLCIVIEDRGAGFDADQLSRGDVLKAGFGLLSMRERLRFLGGGCVIASTPGEGTRVTLTAPLDTAIGVGTTAPEAPIDESDQQLDPLAISPLGQTHHCGSCWWMIMR